jgi:hypothetical protein
MTPSFRDLIAESRAESIGNGCRIKSGMTAAARHDGNGYGMSGVRTPSFRDLIAESSAESPPPMDAGSGPA